MRPLNRRIMNALKKLTFSCGLAVALCSCSHVAGPKTVGLLPPAVQVDRLTDAEVAASFTSDDFSWKDRMLTLSVYSEDQYDSVAVSRLKTGDTIVYQGQSIAVRDIQVKDSFVTINGGVEEGGANLTACAGGKYRGSQLDDHSVYTDQGKVILPLAEDIVLLDCGANPTDPYDTIRVNQEAYLQKLPEYKQTFGPFDTRVEVRGGKVVSVTRHWIP